MAYDPFTPVVPDPVPLTDDQKMALVVDALNQISSDAGQTLLASYKNSMRQVFHNPYGFTAQQVYDALDVANTDGSMLSSDQIKLNAILVKTIVNAVTPDKIVDDIPVATLNLPGGN